MSKKITQPFLQNATLFFICFLSLQAFSQTFTWDNAVDNGDNATETVSGVTATVTTNIITSITDNISVINGNGLGGSSGNIVINPQINNSNSLTVSFSSAIDISTIFAFDADQITGHTWTFTPTGGSNTAVSQAIANDAGSTVTVNWTDVTAFTITSGQGNDTFGVDNITFATTLSTTDFDLQNAVKIYPNPTSDYINIKELTKPEHYTIYTILSKEVLKGIVSASKNIDVQNLPKGMFFIKLNNKETIKFIKK
jgi:hypothetical protein